MIRFPASTTRRTIDEPVRGATGLTAAFIRRRRPTTDAAPTDGAGRADTLVDTLPAGNYYLLSTTGGGVQLWRADTPRIDPGKVSLGVAAGRAAAADVATGLSVNAALNAKFDKIYGRTGG